MKNKPCSKCKIEQPISNFSPDKKNKSGLRSCCRSCSNEMHKKWLVNNKHKLIAAKKRWNENNRDKCILQKIRYRQKNKSRIALLDKEWKKNNFPKIKAANCNALAKRRHKTVNIPNKDLVGLLAAANGLCQYCGKKERLSFDHKTPLVVGGKHKLENMAVVCLSCNARKGRMTLGEFKKYCSDNGITLLI